MNEERVVFQNLFTLVEARVTIGTRLVHGKLPYRKLPHRYSGKIGSQCLSPTRFNPTIRFQGPADAIWILG